MSRRGALGAFFVGLVFVCSATAYAYPSYVSPSYTGTHECTDCHVDPGGGGACNATGAHPLRPCLNPFGYSYFNNGWSGTLSSLNADGDSASNGTELPATSSAGLHNSAAALGCNMATAAASPGVWVNCSSGNVQIMATYSSTGRNHYSLTFRCRPGTSGTSSGTGSWSCTDINECSINRCSPGTCNQYALSSWTSPGYYCSSCGSGRAPSSGAGCAGGLPCCVVTNECLANVDTCVALATCSDPTTSPNDYVCTCPSGYSGNGRSGGTGCQDINECTTMSGICGVGSCANTPAGSYTCTCPSGYTFNGTTCAVSNVCLANTDDCSPNATCTAIGTTDWTCACNAGFTGAGTPLHGTGDVCNDIDECAAVPGPCGAGRCTNSPPGTYTCACMTGYRAPATGGTCTDIDECRENPSICGVGTCANSAGAYACTCPAGYSFTGGTCQDIDECAASPCGVGGTCVETAPPGYACNCDSGWTYDGTTCVDVRECDDPLISLCSSDADCIEMPGSHECVCHDGYEGDGRSCVDVDECARGTDDCDPNATCANTAPWWTCACNAGWQGSGVTCADVDECLAGTHGCETGERCVNQLGAPNTCECLPGLTRQEDGRCAAACGDGARAPGEECDDANDASGDGCASCAIETGWACVEPSGVGPSECTFTCGDGFIDPAEECDDGTAANSDSAPDACRTNCRAASCGDRAIDSDEQCDDGDRNSDLAPDACRTSCLRAYCGDGEVDTGEVCDPGGLVVLDQSSCASCPDAGPDGGVPSLACGCRASSGGERAIGWLLAVIAVIAIRRRRSTR